MYCCNNTADVFVELEESVYSVSEGDSIKQVCAVINTSRLESPVGFNFNVTVSLNGSSRGMRTHSRIRPIIMHQQFLTINSEISALL